MKPSACNDPAGSLQQAASRIEMSAPRYVLPQPHLRKGFRCYRLVIGMLQHERIQDRYGTAKLSFEHEFLNGEDNLAGSHGCYRRSQIYTFLDGDGPP